ncbi:DUF2628 domain-containing protein [Pararhizobium sp. IMCC21322]|uniref:DUF2628 domain-containing protein n=1 Tax=Pararhizobium sp. IMCC21322 TaxID=3067903 RepID=UPI00274136CE|nr:DUF2628 domain-containing protein [Pararhizobium sp. IMCC21322]
MQSYTVHTPPSPSQHERLSIAVFVRDGFHIVALIAPPVWLLWYRQWLGLALYIAALVVLDFATDIASFWALSIVNFLFGLGIALEASTLRRWRLSAKGWQLAGVVSAYDLEDAEERFFASLDEDRKPANTPVRVTSGIPSIRAKPAAPNIIGYQS